MKSSAYAALMMGDDDDDDDDDEEEEEDDDGTEVAAAEAAAAAAAASKAAAQAASLAAAAKAAEAKLAAARKEKESISPPPAVAPPKPLVWWGSEEADEAQSLPIKLTIATSSKRGEHRLHPNEDRYTAVGDLNAELAAKLSPFSDGSAEGSVPPPNAFFGVYDGHGGSSAAQHLCTHLHLLLASDPPLWRDSPKEALRQAFAKAENELREIYMKNPEDKSGSCACVALLRGRRLFVASVGDCRLLLLRSESAADPLWQVTHDHRATDQQERHRILKAGGQITDGRVWGALMPSRVG